MSGRDRGRGRGRDSGKSASATPPATQGPLWTFVAKTPRTEPHAAGVAKEKRRARVLLRLLSLLLLLRPLFLRLVLWLLLMLQFLELPK